MLVAFKPVRNKNPRDFTLPAKYYGKDVSKGEITLEKLFKLISDVYGIIISFINSLFYEITVGKTIEFGKSGNLSHSTESVIGVDELSSTYFKKSKLLYKPNRFMRKLLSNLEYRMMPIK